jgi:apolipoprotein D and lipocalin family protein
MGSPNAANDVSAGGVLFFHLSGAPGSWRIVLMKEWNNKGDHMKKLLHRFFLVFCCVILADPGARAQGLTVVDSVDLTRYAGKWYEIARLPNRFQEDCIGDVTATYSLLDDGDIKVVNRCTRTNGESVEAEGRARRAGSDAPTSKLKVRFAPSFLSFLPFVWGDYWIIDLASDYSYAVVGEPDRKYLWVLSRSPVMDNDLLAAILARAKNQGYDTAPLIRTRHTQ